MDLVPGDAEVFGCGFDLAARRVHFVLGAIQFSKSLFDVDAHLAFSMADVFPCLRDLRMTLPNKTNALAKLRDRPLRPEADDFGVVRQKRSSILMNVLHESGDIRNIFRASGTESRTGLI